MSASYAYHNRKAREPDRQDHEEHRAETVTRQLFHRSPRVDFIASTLPEDQFQGEDRQDEIEDPPGDQTDKTRDLRAAPRLMHRFTNRPRTVTPTANVFPNRVVRMPAAELGAAPSSLQIPPRIQTERRG